MKISKMHYTDSQKENMVLVTFTEDSGHTTSSVFSEAGWALLEQALVKDAEGNTRFLFEDES